MSKKKIFVKVFLTVFCVFACNGVFAADSSESCSDYDALQYKAYGACETRQRECCSSSGKWSNWGEDCTCGKNECYITYSKQCVERCTEGYTEAKSSKCNYHGTYIRGCGYGPSSICKTYLVGSKPCKCDEGYTGTYCDKKAVTAESVWVSAAVQSAISGGGYSMWVFACDNLIYTEVPTYNGAHTITYSCGSGGNYSFGSTRTSGPQAALSSLENGLCKLTNGDMQGLCEEKGANYNCVISIEALTWGWDVTANNTSSYYETRAKVLKCKEAI